MQLVPEKCQRIAKQIKNVIRKKCIPLLTFQQLVGRLQHASSFGILGGKGLLSPKNYYYHSGPQNNPSRLENIGTASVSFPHASQTSCHGLSKLHHHHH